MRTQRDHRHPSMMVPTIPARIPMLRADDLPGDEDWALLMALRGEVDDAFDHDLQHDRYGSLMLAPVAFD
ncbi:MAG: hypothetical protein ABIR52_14540 [Casimicrobiaceae bacterium]